MFEVDDNSRSEMDASLSPKPPLVAELPVDDEHQRFRGATKG
jgi:hypothetical protein